MNALQITWFCLISLVLAIYTVLDGFDLGVGIWYLFSGGEGSRRALLGAIAPYWDGNEVWLLTGGGAVFAAFPAVYASIFSGLYLALMLVLFGLIFRAVSIEFRGQSDSPSWRRGWGLGFALGSMIPALLFGVAVGNVLRGLPLDAAGNFTGSFFTLLNPYSLLIGVTGFAMFAYHGALFASLKSAGPLAERAKKWAGASGVVYGVLFTVSFVVTAAAGGRIVSNFHVHPALWVLPVLALASAWGSATFATSGRQALGFVLSSVNIISIFATISASLFPNMIPAINNPSLSLTIVNGSSSPLTLKTMLILATIGVPIVLIYTIWVHRMFWGKTSEAELNAYGAESV